jgi:hypothetical protein
MSNPNPRSAQLNPKARSFLDKHIRNASGRRARPRELPDPDATPSEMGVGTAHETASTAKTAQAGPNRMPDPSLRNPTGQRARPREAVNPNGPDVSQNGATGGSGQAEKPYQAAQREGQAYAPTMILRKFRLLDAEYRKLLPRHTEMAPALTLQYEVAKRAVEGGDMGAAATALSDLESTLKLPLPERPVLKSAGKTTGVGASPLTADAVEWRPDVPDREGLALKLKTDLESKLVDLDAALRPLYGSSIGVDLKTLRLKLTNQLAAMPLGMPNVIEAEALFKELRIKAEFIQKRDHKIGNRRRKLDEYAKALEFQPGAADALLKDKSLKAGGHFTDFAKALKAYEADPTSKQAAAVTTAIDSYLKHFAKFSETEKAKPENQAKRKAVVDIQTKLAARDVILQSKQMAAKRDWTREDESRATEQYLKMMLLMSEAPPRNLKGEHATEKVLAVKNVKGADKLVIKPVTGEYPVEGFTPGGGASREMMASVMGDKLQEMLGIDLNVAVTKLVSVDGGKLGLDEGTPVTVSAQAFAKESSTLMDQFKALMDAEVKKRGVKDESLLPGDVLDALKKSVVDKIPKEEVQNKAIFDLISLHCDRHIGNFMAGPDKKLIPIDHGNILPTKAGILARKAQMGPPHAVLATTPAANEKLSDEQVERIAWLDSKELLDTMRAAQTDMRKNTPDADKGDLEEGLNNSKRSIEFLKFACRRLTLGEIYAAYSASPGDIFFTKEDDKNDGFERAVRFALTYIKAVDDLEAKMNEMKVTVFNGRREYGDLLPDLQKRGWFLDVTPAQFEDWVAVNPQKLLKVLSPNCPPPAPAKVTPYATKEPKPLQFLGKPVKTSEWEAYQRAGGDREWEKAGFDANVPLAQRAERLERPRYEALGGDAAWLGAGGGDFVPLATRIERLEALQGAAMLQVD